MIRRPPRSTLFPTRRSSDLDQIPWRAAAQAGSCAGCHARDFKPDLHPKSMDGLKYTRSEEHTSELQSLRHLVCRLLLEKKKKKTTSYHDSQKKTHRIPQ